MKTYEGKDIREVWDWRLSRGNPVLYNDGDTWVIRVYANSAPDGERVMLKEIVTEMPTVVNGVRDVNDHAAIAKCYELLRAVRDEFSRDHIEDRKPVVKLINESNKEATRINDLAVQAELNGDTDECDRLRGKLSRHLDAANAEIKKSAAAMQKRIAA
jgi:hypothetical protein